MAPAHEDHGLPFVRVKFSRDVVGAKTVQDARYDAIISDNFSAARTCSHYLSATWSLSFVCAQGDVDVATGNIPQFYGAPGQLCAIAAQVQVARACRMKTGCNSGFGEISWI